MKEAAGVGTNSRNFFGILMRTTGMSGGYTMQGTAVVCGLGRKWQNRHSRANTLSQSKSRQPEAGTQIDVFKRQGQSQTHHEWISHISLRTEAINLRNQRAECHGSLENRNLRFSGLPNYAAIQS
eukprot:2634415-Amphidinium_carterae.1